MLLPLRYVLAHSIPPRQLSSHPAPFTRPGSVRAASKIFGTFLKPTSSGKRPPPAGPVCKLKRTTVARAASRDHYFLRARLESGSQTRATSCGSHFKGYVLAQMKDFRMISEGWEKEFSRDEFRRPRKIHPRACSPIKSNHAAHLVSGRCFSEMPFPAQASIVGGIGLLHGRRLGRQPIVPRIFERTGCRDLAFAGRIFGESADSTLRPRSFSWRSKNAPMKRSGNDNPPTPRVSIWNSKVAIVAVLMCPCCRAALELAFEIARVIKRSIVERFACPQVVGQSLNSALRALRTRQTRPVPDLRFGRGAGP